MSYHYVLPEISESGKIGCSLPALDVPPTELPPKQLLQQEESVQGALQLMFELEEYLTEITGTHATSLVPIAGAHGEFTGLLLVKAYHQDRGDKARKKILFTQ